MMVHATELQARAIDYTKVGGDVEKAKVFATLALAEALREIDIEHLAQKVDEALTFVGDNIGLRS